MFKKITKFALFVLIFNAVSINSAYAGTKEDNEARFAEKVKANVNKLGTGKEARIEVKLRDKTKLKGYVSQINENGFVVVEDNTNAATEVPYSNAKQVKGNNLSTGTKILIVAGVVAAIFVISYIAAIFFAE